MNDISALEREQLMEIISMKNDHIRQLERQLADCPTGDAYDRATTALWKWRDKCKELEQQLANHKGAWDEISNSLESAMKDNSRLMQENQRLRDELERLNRGQR